MQTAVNVFLDLDGVLVNLEKALKEKFNFEFPKEQLSQEEFERLTNGVWDKAAAIPGFWTNLPPTSEWYDLYHEVKQYNPTILSASPHHYDLNSAEHDKCAQEKIDWVRKMLGSEQAKRTIITKSNLKQMYVTPGIPSILIDDLPGNIDRWNAAGGIGVLHKTGHLEPTIHAFHKALEKINAGA